MCSQVLHELHASHRGAVRTKQRAKLIVYWPGIDNDIDNIILACKQCQDSLPSHSEAPIIMKLRPSRPFQEIAVDIQGITSSSPCHPHWPDIIHLGCNTTAPHLITTLLRTFCRPGAPDIVWSDQGPQFTSKLFEDFSKEWGFQHITSSPMYLQSNRKAEATVKSMKKLIQASWTCGALDERKLT